MRLRSLLPFLLLCAACPGGGGQDARAPDDFGGAATDLRLRLDSQSAVDHSASIDSALLGDSSLAAGPDLASGDLGMPDLAMPEDLTPGPDMTVICHVDNDCLDPDRPHCVCDDGSPKPCAKEGTCCTDSCLPGTHCGGYLGRGCFCDISSCPDHCCTNGEDGCSPASCGPPPPYGQCEILAWCDTGPNTTCRGCGNAGTETCVLDDGALYCTCYAQLCRCPNGCVGVAFGACYNGTSDSYCGMNGGPCVTCPQGKHCVNRTCQ